ncbi:TBC1 domain family member 19 [Phytophthora citrophthora]|uniref:TBC1 domain family member 19 n=1 Tax=Phytophthora citrophthora TaxID=4793 RepID=A0AAD9GXV1_9STRA|nr:TBC1 domain family member 19 [Phytophthora citrophthora]
MYLLDLQQTIDSSDYFVFQDHLESVLMAFTRDTYVKSHALQVNGAVTCEGIPPTSSFQPHEHADTTENRVPPNGVLPFSGLVMYMAPLAYLYADPVELYYVFRELYVKYWSKLNAIRSERGTILPLCKLFEDLVVRSSPAAVFHLINVGLKPLDIAFPWIQCAFSGVLDIDQVLLVWDRMIGYDSLELVAILAAALFHFRSGELELVNTREEAKDLFAELIDIPVVTLLQDYLFGLR